MNWYDCISFCFILAARCAAHILQLGIHDALKARQNEIEEQMEIRKEQKRNENPNEVNADDVKDLEIETMVGEIRQE